MIEKLSFLINLDKYKIKAFLSLSNSWYEDLTYNLQLDTTVVMSWSIVHEESLKAESSPDYQAVTRM